MPVHVYLVHHGEAVGSEIDPRRPLSDSGRLAVERSAAEAAARGALPSVVWHSGKLRARQTAEAFWRACNALAEFSATRGIQPGDPPEWIGDRLRGETRDAMLVGHFPHLPQLLDLLRREPTPPFPLHGVVALLTDDGGQTWREDWRIQSQMK